MSCIVLDLELGDENVVKKMGVFNDGNVHGFSSRLQKDIKSTKEAFWCTKNFQGIVWDSGCLDYCELPNVLLRDVKGG